MVITTAILLTLAALSTASAADSEYIRGGKTIEDFDGAPSGTLQHLANNYDEEYEDDGPCLDSFPLASSDSLGQLPSELLPVEAYNSYSELEELPNNERHLRSTQKRRSRNLSVSIPTDETRRSYAPLCDDGKRIDIRKLMRCTGGSCYDEFYQVSFSLWDERVIVLYG